MRRSNEIIAAAAELTLSCHALQPAPGMRHAMLGAVVVIYLRIAMSIAAVHSAR